MSESAECADETGRGERLDQLEAALLERAELDWLGAGDVVSVLIEHGITDHAAIRDRGVAMLERLLRRGDLVAGALEDTGFVPTGEAPEDVAARVGPAWDALGAEWPRQGDIAWFDLTAQGQRRLAAQRASS